MKSVNKSTLFIGIFVALFISVIMVECAYGQLFTETNTYIKVLNNTENSYGIFETAAIGCVETSDHNFKILPMGRLVCVNTSYNMTMTKYILKTYYIFNSTVKDIFINECGTITIDCRNYED